MNSRCVETTGGVDKTSEVNSWSVEMVDNSADMDGKSVEGNKKQCEKRNNEVKGLNVEVGEVVVMVSVHVQLARSKRNLHVSVGSQTLQATEMEVAPWNSAP